MDFKRKPKNISIRAIKAHFKSFISLILFTSLCNGKFLLFSKSLFSRKISTDAGEKFSCSGKNSDTHSERVEKVFCKKLMFFLLFGCRLVALGTFPTRTKLTDDLFKKYFQRIRAVICTWQYKEIILRQRRFLCLQILTQMNR